MDSKVFALFKNARIEISSYGMHYRKEMRIVDRILPCYVMSYHKSGKAILRIKGKEYQLGKGQFILLPPDISHDHIVEKGIDTELYWWHFTFQIGGCVDVLRLLYLPYVSWVDNTEQFEQMFEHYCQQKEDNLSIPGLLYEKARSFEILAFLFENLLQKTGYDASDIPDPFVDMFQDIIDASSAAFSLHELSERYFLNPTYISNRFKEYFGVSPISLHRKLLIEKAKNLLGSGKLSVSEVAAQLGFENSQTFSRFFLSKTGMRPSQYRASKR